MIIPEEIELVGGPYDGVIIHPGPNCMHTVLDQLDAQHFPWSGPVLPDNGDLFEDEGFIIVGGQQLGEAMYQMESEHRWQYVPMEAALT